MKSNGNLSSLDLTNNELKDVFVTIALNALKSYPHILSIKVLENTISLKRIEAINEALERNMKLAKKYKIPNFNREIFKLKRIVGNGDRVSKTIKQVGKECKETQKVVEDNKKLLENTKQTELAKSKVLEKQMRKINKEYKEIYLQCEEMKDKFKYDNEVHINKTNDIRNMIKEMN